MTIKVDLSKTSGIIITSSNAVRSLKQSEMIFNGPMFCVGDATALLAKKEGYYSVSSDGNTDDLFRLIKNLVPVASNNLTYFRGEEITVDLAGSLRKLDYNVEEVICYRKSPYFLSQRIIRGISSSSIIGATFFSKQTVNLFYANVKFIPDGFVAFCISEEVSRVILSLYSESVITIRISKYPTMQAMCKLVVAAPEFEA